MSDSIDLRDLGWTPTRASHWQAHHASSPDTAPDLEPGRVFAQHRGALRIHTRLGPFDAEISGRLRYLVADETDLPVVGDWVVAALHADEAKATVHDVLPRTTALIRGTPGDRRQDAQVLAANVDCTWVVTSMNRDFNIRRVERTLAIIRESGSRAAVVLTKGDLTAEPERYVDEVMASATDVPVHVVSAHAGSGLDPLREQLQSCETIALIGSSGVGKSTLVNHLAGREILATSAIRADDDRGRHTTTHRELVVLPGGGAVIDTPGLRELALWSDDEGGIAGAFPDLEALFARCRFGDCQHGNEPGCAVQAALEEGALDPARLAHYGKLKREARHMARRRDAKGRHEERREGKAFTRMVRQHVDKKRR